VCGLREIPSGRGGLGIEGGMSSPTWPMDVALQQLRGLALPYKWDERDLCVWWAVCPACKAQEWALRLREAGRGGPVSLSCSTGCDSAAIHASLAADPNALRLVGALELGEEASRIAHQALDHAQRRLAA
jgi:hypothetical protein